MTCGVCEPKSMREAVGTDKEKGRVYGYLVAATLTEATTEARKLYFMGAEVVFADERKGRVADRPGFKGLTHPVMLRKGDALILADVTALGTHRSGQEAHLKAMEARGVKVSILKPEFFGEE